LISSDYAENWPEPDQRHLQRLMGDHLISACTDTQRQKCELQWKTKCWEKVLSCSFYLYRFRKFVSYGFPIIIFLSRSTLWNTLFFTARRATNDNMVREDCGWIHKTTHTHTHTHTICNNYCCTTVTMVARTRLIVALFVHCPSCSFSLHHITRILATFENGFLALRVKNNAQLPSSFGFVCLTHSDVCVDLLGTISEILQKIKIKNKEINLGSVFCHIWIPNKGFVDISHRKTVSVWPVQLRWNFMDNTLGQWKR
jgi:hypothetical protein